MHNCFQLVCRHDTLILGLFNLVLVYMLEYAIIVWLASMFFFMYTCSFGHLPIARHVILLVVLVFLDTLDHRPVTHTHRLHQRCEVFHVEVTVRASVRLA